MENRYQQFLRETLRRGLLDLEKEPSALEVVGIPKSSFEIFVRIFRNGLSPDIQKNLPLHNLTNQKYLRLLVSQIDLLLQKPGPETEKILANMPPLKNLELAYQKGQERQATALAQHQNWQTTFSQQIKQYNLDLASRLDKQLQEQFPKLSENPGKRKSLVLDMAQTIQRQGLTDIKGDYKTQAQDVIEKVVQTTIKHYATEIEDLQTEQMASNPQVREEKINTVSQAIAQDEADPALAIRRDQIRAETPPDADPVYKIKTVLETSVLVNLPPELAADPKLVEAVTEEMMGRVHMASGSSEAEYQGYLAQQVKIILTQTKVAKILEQKKLDSSQIEKMAETLSAPLAEEISPEIYEAASSPAFGQTPFAGSVAGFAPAGAAPTVQIIPPIPPAIPQAPIPPVPGAPALNAAPVNVSGPSVGIPGISGGGLSVVGYVGKDTPLELLQAEGSPLHFLSALTSPRAAADLGKYLITLGPVRSLFWFGWESFGWAKPDYLQIGLFSLDQMYSGLFISLNGLRDEDGNLVRNKKGNFVNEGLKAQLAAASGHEKYVLQKETDEVKARFNFVKQFFDGVHDNPALDRAYKLFFGEEKKILGVIDTSNWWGPFKNMSLGTYHLLHPWQTIINRLYQKDILLGLGVSGLFGSLSAYVQYGGYGGSYTTAAYIKTLGVYLLKVAGSKIGLYGVYGEGLSRRYELKIWHEAKEWMKHGIKGTARAVAARVLRLLPKTARKAVWGAVTKIATWLGTRVGSLISVVASWIGVALLVWDLIKIAWAYFKKLLKWTAIAFAALMFWLFANFSPLEIILSMASGIPWALALQPLLFPFFGPFALPAGWMIGTFTTASIIKGIKGLFGYNGPLEAVPGDILSGLGNFAGDLLHSLTTQLSSSLVGSVAPILITTGGILGVGYFYMTMVTSSAFWLPSQIPQIQSSYFEVKKSASFSGKIGEPIKYTLLIGVKTGKKDAKLVNLKISDKSDASCTNQPPIIAERNFLDKIPANITLASPLTIEYSVPTDNGFNDCLITNTATVTADVENGPSGEESFYTASVTIGNPPVDLPSGWPLTTGCLTQGPNGSTSHAQYQEEALDINGSLINKPVFATHNGTVSRVVNNQNQSTTGYGNYVILQGVGQKGTFSTIYAHLMTVNVAKGQKIKKGTQLGTVGSSGHTDGPHLHYEFLGLKLTPPFIPVDINNIRSCSSRGACNLCF